MDGEVYLPYLINYSQPVVENIVIFCVAMLTAIIASAEGQGFVATLLGDSEPGAEDRLHFNVVLHMSLLGTLCFFVAGFGWAKQLKINTNNFKSYPHLFLFISRISGPLANLLMANIAASISWILSRYGVEDKVFSTIVVVNITMAVYSMIPIPPLPGSAFVQLLLAKNKGAHKTWKVLCFVGPYFLIGLFLLFRLTGYEGISSLVNPVVRWLITFALDI